MCKDRQSIFSSYRWSLCVLWMWSVSLMLTAPAEAGTRRALLIGINRYTPAVSTSGKSGTANKSAQAVATDAASAGRAALPDLSGAVNDAQAMQAILARYEFPPEHVRVLLNEQATRANILAAIKEQLVISSQKGDEVFFHYSGHGSQVVNSRSSEADKMDETLVPADASAGAPDIRDKELRRLFNDILDKGARLTVIIDSCHSGSVARGLANPGQARNVPPDTRDIAARVANEAPDPRPDPENRGALILSAAQDYQSAYEVTDDESQSKQKHGAFTLALWKTLRTANRKEPAEQVFRRARALLRTDGKLQDPVLAGSAERRQAPLFGSNAQLTTSEITIAVQEVNANGGIALQGGLAAGLRRGCELERMPEKGNESNARIRVEQVDGWNRSTARMISGEAKAIRAGDFFKLVKWAAPDVPDVRVWLSPAIADADLARVAKELAALRNAPRFSQSTVRLALFPAR